MTESNVPQPPKTTVRSPRKANSRETSERVKEWRPPHLRTALRNEDGADWVYRWIREEYRNTVDKRNMESKLQEGYEIVRPDDPEVADMVERGELTSDGSRVVKGGLVLARLPRAFADKRNQHYTNEAKLHQQNVDTALGKIRNSKMPLTVDKTHQRSNREG